jgi:hypothetical protein
MKKKVILIVTLAIWTWWAIYLPVRSFYPKYYPPLKVIDYATMGGVMTSFLLQKFVKEEADSSKKYGTLIQVLCVVPLIFILIRTLVLKWG